MGLQDMDILIAVATGLGKREEDGDGSGYYVKDPECLENLKDLQRFMRRDNPETRDVFMQLGQWNIVRRDLVPIITTYRSNYELVLAAVKVIVFLTMPPLPESDSISRQLEYLQRFKAAFLEDEALGVIVAMMEEPLAHLESEEFSDEDARLVQLFLTLFRNLLAISDPSSHKTAASGGAHLAYMKEELLERFFQESVMDLLIALAPHVSHEGRKGPLRNDNLLLLEIFFFTFKDQKPGDLLAAVAEQARGKSSKQLTAASAELLELLEEERRKKAQVLMSGPPRHSFFTGTFTRRWKDGAPSILRSNPFVSDFDRLAAKSSVRSARMKPVAPREETVHLSSRVRGMLKEHADQFLAGGYTVLLKTVKDDIRRESARVAPMDAVMFFKVAGFFTAYQKERLQAAKSLKADAKRKSSKERSSEDEERKKAADAAFAAAVRGCGEIAATMDEEMFNMVVSRWREYADTIKEGKEFSALAAAGALLKDMIHILDLILKTADVATDEGRRERSVANILLLKVFYDQTDTGILSFLVRLIKAYDRTKQPKADMGNLVEMAHTILRMLEEYSKNNGEIRVLKKVRKVRRKKKVPPASAALDEEAGGLEQPGEGTVRPGGGIEQPGEETDRPGEGTEQAGERSEQQGEQTEWPVEGAGGLENDQVEVGDETDQPVEESERPVGEAERPREGTESLIDQTMSPLEGTESLVRDTEQPVDDTERSGQGADRSAGETEPLCAETGGQREGSKRLEEETEVSREGGLEPGGIQNQTEAPPGTEPVGMECETERLASEPLTGNPQGAAVQRPENPADVPDVGQTAAGEPDGAAEPGEGDPAEGIGGQRSPGNVSGEQRDGFVESDPEDSVNPGPADSFGQRPDSAPEESFGQRPDSAPEESGVLRFDAVEESGVIGFDDNGPQNSGEVSQAPTGVQAGDQFASTGVQQDEYEEYEEEEEEDNTREVVLDARACAFMFADNTVVRNLVWMLEGYRGNTVQVNYYIGRMLERVSKDCELEPMLYQLAFFSTFYEVVSDAGFCRAKENALLTDLLTKIVRHFMAIAAEQPLVFMELLFWKTMRECHLISQQYKEEEKKGRRGRQPKGLGDDENGERSV